MKFSAAQIAEMLDGQIDGDPELEVDHLAKIEEGQKGSLSFLANPKYTPHLYKSRASVVIVSRDFIPDQKVHPTLIRVDDAYQSFARLLEVYNQQLYHHRGIHPQAVVEDTAKIDDDVYLGPQVYVGANAVIGKGTQIYPGCFVGDRARIGQNCLLHSGARILMGCELGDEVTLHSGVVIGSDGFGFAPQSETYAKVPQIGNVIVGHKVEIGANTTVDRATMGHTRIGEGVKLDNLIQIAHNVEIGENTVIAAQTGIAGSTRIGKNCMIGGQVGIIGHLKIGNNVKIAAQSGISSDLPDNSIVQGSPAFSIGDYKKSYVYFRKLPALAAALDKLKKQVFRNAHDN